MNERVIITPLEEKDLAAAAAIEEGTVESWSAEALGGELSSPAGRCFALWAEEELAGLALWQAAADEASLLKISIKESRRGQGLGACLLRECLVRLRGEGAARFFLEVRAGNAPAIALYKKCGFYIAGRRRGFYQSPPEDALVMNREDEC